MGFYFPDVVYRNLCWVKGRYRCQSFLLWLTLSSWITYTAGQGKESVAVSGYTRGVISSPNYPLNYPNNLTCTWHLRSSPYYTNIGLKFNNFQTEAGFDVLNVYDEKGIVASLSGYTLPRLMTLGRTARLVFTTDRSISSTGFQANFTSVAIPPLLPCGGVLEDSGTIQSPNYPLYYPNNAYCLWSLRSNDTGIRIQFTSFKLEKDYDYVKVTDMPKLFSVKRYTGNVLPPTMLLGKEVMIEFYSDRSNTMQGFTATFVSISITSRNQCMTNDTFWCTSDQKCISSNRLCDEYADCRLSEDELLCPLTTATAATTAATATTATTAKTTKTTKKAATAPTTLFLKINCQQLGKFWCSRSVKCVSSSYRCDNHNDCVYGEDEVDCTNIWQQQCQQSLKLWCGTSRQCISSYWKCDGTNDCRYGEDEERCVHIKKATLMSPETITAIVIGNIWGVILLVVLLARLIRVVKLRRLRLANPRSNNYLQTTARPSATVWSTPATYSSRFGAPNRQAGGPPGTGGLPLDQYTDQYAPPSYEATMKAYATGQFAYPVAQPGDVRPSNTPTFTAPSTQ